MKQTFLLVLLFAALFATAQSPVRTKFDVFMKTQDSLLTVDYKAKDIKSFHKHFDQMLAEYNKQNAKVKTERKGYIQSAYYNLGCTYALVGDKKNALDNLMKSDFDDYDHVLEDTDLDILRDEPGFKKYLQKVRGLKSDMLLTLQKDAKYNLGEKKTLPAFTYQSAEDPHLAELKKMYNLDSIAGKSSEIIRVINLMHWVHNTIRHNGNGGLPDERNAMNMLTTCSGKDKACNCRGLGITLNEVYLAAGFKSRFVTCLPKDTADNDCHVITTVYSKVLRKWVWMDPTFDAYIMDEHGDLLGIEEVRDRLVHDKPLILNPEANWNHKSAESKQYYLGYYMPKNLYRIECPVRSEYNSDTYAEGKLRSYIELKPVAYMPDQDVRKNKTATYIVYKTSNPVPFWAAPK